MDREKRLEKFKKFIADGNELTVSDMLAVVIGNISLSGEKELHDMFLVDKKMYVVDIKEKGLQ